MSTFQSDTSTEQRAAIVRSDGKVLVSTVLVRYLMRRAHRIFHELSALVQPQRGSDWKHLPLVSLSAHPSLNTQIALENGEMRYLPHCPSGTYV